MSDPTVKKQAVINNNKCLYASVFASHGIPLLENDNMYYSLRKAPPLNSNICTKVPQWRPESIFETIEKTAQEEDWDSWSVKDSFCDLDLAPYGFETLFDAQWLYLQASDFVPAFDKPALVFRQVRTKEELDLWNKVWAENEALYQKNMLDDPSLTFVIGHENDTPTHAALLNRSDDVLGISNFFPEEDVAGRWGDLIAYIQEVWGPIDIVGYERKDTIAQLAPLHILPVGDLRIWIKRYA
jgi:hypothetical protein